MNSDPITRLRYGNTNTFYISGAAGGLLIDTDYAGMLPGYFRAIKAADIRLADITFVMATHYHPDHVGLIGELQELGVTLLIADVQLPFAHYADGIFTREKQPSWRPVNEQTAKVISVGESRSFLSDLGISGEIIRTPSHSEDSITVILDSGTCFVGDLEPFSFLAAYESNVALKQDWDRIMDYHPKKILYAHANGIEI